MAAEETWHYVEAKRDDGAPTSFKIRELEPRPELARIFVVELPYPTTQMSRMPDVAAYRRLAELEQHWLRPACAAVGWEFVGWKIEDGSFFLYMYGATDHGALVQRLSPFDPQLGFYDDDDPTWSEYGTLRELLELAKAMPVEPIEAATVQNLPRVKQPRRTRHAKAKAKTPKNPKKPTRTTRTKPKSRPKKPTPKRLKTKKQTAKKLTTKPKKR